MTNAAPFTFGAAVPARRVAQADGAEETGEEHEQRAEPDGVVEAVERCVVDLARDDLRLAPGQAGRRRRAERRLACLRQRGLRQDACDAIGWICLESIQQSFDAIERRAVTGLTQHDCSARATRPYLCIP